MTLQSLIKHEIGATVDDLDSEEIVKKSTTPITIFETTGGENDYEINSRREQWINYLKNVRAILPFPQCLVRIISDYAVLYASTKYFIPYDECRKWSIGKCRKWTDSQWQNQIWGCLKPKRHRRHKNCPLLNVLKESGLLKRLRVWDVICFESIEHQDRNNGSVIWIGTENTTDIDNKNHCGIIDYYSEFDEYGSPWPSMSVNIVESTLFWEYTLDVHGPIIWFNAQDYEVVDTCVRYVCKEHAPGIKIALIKRRSSSSLPLSGEKWIDSSEWYFEYISTDELETLLLPECKNSGADRFIKIMTYSDYPCLQCQELMVDILPWRTFTNLL